MSKTLHDDYLRICQEQFSPKNLLRHLLIHRLDDLGICPTMEQIQIIEEVFLQGKADLVLEFSDSQLQAAGYSSETQFQPKFDEIVHEFMDWVKHADVRIPEILAEVNQPVIEETGSAVWTAMQQTMELHLESRLAESDRIRSELRKNWGKAFDYLEMLIVVCHEILNGYSKKVKIGKTTQDDMAVSDEEVTCRMFARACEICTEILTLLRSGLANGAIARWRSLHELCVVFLFLQEHGSEIMERFILHCNIGRYRHMEAFKKIADMRGTSGPSPKEMSKAKESFERLLEKFGRSFERDYGWAQNNSKSIDCNNFRDVEENVDLQYVRALYKTASSHVHAGSYGLFLHTGLAPEFYDILLSGPSDYGLADPGEGAVRALSLMATFFAVDEPTIESLVSQNVVQRITDNALNEFSVAHKKMERKAYFDHLDRNPGRVVLESLRWKRNH